MTEHPARWVVGAVVGALTLMGGCASYTLTRYDELMERSTTNRERIEELERRQNRMDHRLDRLEDQRRTGAEAADR